METVGNQGRINRALAAAVGDPVAVTAVAAPGADIPSGASYVEITSAAAANIVNLPGDATVGKRVSGYVGANGCKLRSLSASGTPGAKINNVAAGGTPDTAGGTIPATSFFTATLTSGGWIAQGNSAVGAAATIAVA